MKRFWAFCLLICIICTFLTSCKTDKKERYRIGITLCNDDLWHETLIKELQHEALLYPDIELIAYSNRNGNDQIQIDQIRSFINNKVDLIAVSAGNAEVITPIVKEAYQKGFPVIIIDQKILSDDYTAYVGGDNYRIGTEVGLFIANLLQGQGNVVEIRGRTESTTDIERHEGFRDIISHYPGIQIVAEKRANFEVDLAEKEMEEIIQANLSIDVIFAMDDMTAKGVHYAYRKAGIKQPFLIGVDALGGKDGGIENIVQGYQDVSFIYPTGGDKVIEIAHHILTGKHFERSTILYTGIVDRSNAHLIQQQKEHLFTEREKVTQVNDSLNEISYEYARQRIFFYITLFIVFLIAILLIISIIAYRSKSKSRAKLAEQYQRIEQQNLEIRQQNDEIRKQAEILTQQKEQLEELSEKLKEATQAKLLFFTNISHEFKTPLSLILAPLKTLLNTPGISPVNKQLIELARRNSEILLNLISQIIDFNKYENHYEKVAFTRNDLTTFLCGLNELFYLPIKQKQIEFLFETDGDNFDIWFDKEKIERVYLNILSNALRFVPEKGCIRIRLQKEIKDNKEYARLEVFNSGNTIDEDKINTIFTRFYKIDEQDAGTGIGLALANILVNLHHGTIHAYNKANEGVIFSVCLPFEQPQEIQSTETVSLPEKSRFIPETYPSTMEELSTENSGKKPTITVVEDNPDIRSYIKIILQNEYRIIEADNGNDGLTNIRKYVPDLVLCDIMMPGMNGLEVCRAVKEYLPTCHIPVILLTARSLYEHEVEGLEHGADLYITKPFDGELLKIRLRKLIENRKKIIDVFSRNFINDSQDETLGNVEQEYINRIQNYVMEHINDSGLDIETIAKSFGESYTNMYRKIKSYTGYTPVELIRLTRLKYARQLLNLKTKNITTVAYEAGFSTPSYFTRCFKEFYKESPTEYVKNLDNREVRK